MKQKDYCQRVVLTEIRVDGAQAFYDLDTHERIWLSNDQAIPGVQVGNHGTLIKTGGKWIMITKGSYEPEYVDKFNKQLKFRGV